jgi:hypothetical protein
MVTTATTVCLRSFKAVHELPAPATPTSALFHLPKLHLLLLSGRVSTWKGIPVRARRCKNIPAPPTPTMLYFKLCACIFLHVLSRIKMKGHSGENKVVQKQPAPLIET